MKYDLVIQNGKVVLEDKVIHSNIGIKDGKIADVFESDQFIADNVIDANNKYVMPGAIDTHTHFFEPGASYREDFEHGTKAAASGGFTCIMEMPNSNPAVVDLETFEMKRKFAEKGAVIDYALWGGATATNLDNLDILKNLGCIALKGFTLYAGTAFPYLNTEMQMDAMKKVKALNMILGFHAEDPVIVKTLTEKYQSQSWNLKIHDMSRPYYAELAAISQILLFSKETGCPVHICHLSIPEGAELISKAKQDNVNVTVESCSHYFLLNYEDYYQYDTYALIQPPIRSRRRMDNMWKYLMNGTIDYLATDHAPYTEEEKEPENGNKWDVMGGSPSIDVAFPMMFDETVIKRGMDPIQFVKLSSTNAAKRFGMYPRKGSICKGADADIVILNPNEPWIIDRSKSFSKSKNTKFPYQGRKVNCKVNTTLVRGNVVYNNGQITVDNGHGILIKP
ncbi:MAG: allantoinase AllB [Herbinix sp.]|nr:allantoinase AllB [Herbinix sp.]